MKDFVKVHLGSDGVWIQLSDGNKGGYCINLDAIDDPNAKRCADHYRKLCYEMSLETRLEGR